MNVFYFLWCRMLSDSDERGVERKSEFKSTAHSA